MMRDDFDKWTEQWEKAQAEGIFDDAPKPPVPSSQYEPSDFFGNWRPNNDSDVKDIDAEYWKRVYQMSRHGGDTPDPLEDVEQLNEQHEGDSADIDEDPKPFPSGMKKKIETLVPTTKPDNKSVADITDELGKQPNPVRYYTRGEDQRNKVTPNWAAGKDLEELHDMKVSLEKLESKMNSADGLGESKKAQSIMNQIESLWKKIDELSNDITPEFRDEYLS